jgi:disulfide bond formation protein DsbB
MLHKIPVRAFFGLSATICLAILASAFYAQHGPQHQQPCPLCILQRYGYMAIALTALIATLHGPGRVGAIVYALIADVFASAGLAVAVWLVLKGHTMKSCMEDPIGNFVNGLPSADWWPEFLFATGGCGDVYPPLFGLAVPVWSLTWFVVFSVALMLFMFNKIRNK